MKNCIYNCPECHKDIAVGNLLSLRVICPYCMELIIIDAAQDGRPRSVGNPVSKRTIKRTYGRNKLTIAQMVSTKTDALKAGHSHYYTGQPCRNGHLSPRNKRGECHECCMVIIKKCVEKKQREVQGSTKGSRGSQRKKKPS